MILLYSSRPEIIKHWSDAFGDKNVQICKNEKEMYEVIDKDYSNIILLVEHRQYDNIEDFLSLFQKEYPKVKIMLFSNKPSYEQGHALLKFGIKAYANTYMRPMHLKAAYLTVKSGKVWLYPEFIQMMINELLTSKNTLHVKDDTLLSKLSQRETQIALLLKEGLSNKEIALRTGISERTVKAHLSAVFEKTGIKDRLTLALSL